MRAENYYELLQVSENADQEIIQAAYRRLVLRYHPDRSSEPNAAEMTQRLNDAYAILSDPVQRAEYDRERRGSTGRPSSGTGRSRPNPPPPPRPPPPRPAHAERNADSNDRFSGNVKWVAFPLAGFVVVMVVVGVVVNNSGSDPVNERTSGVSKPAPYRAPAATPRQLPRVSSNQPTATPYAAPTPRRNLVTKPSAIPASRHEYFTVGSTKDEVIAVQGDPDQATERRWSYRGSIVEFHNGLVSTWENKSYGDKLRVRMEPSSPVESNMTYFTVGSTKDVVLAVQGTPDEFTDTRWSYGGNVIRFHNGQVVSWQARSYGKDALKAQKIEKINDG